jgi:integrase
LSGSLQWADIDWEQNTLSISKQLGLDRKLVRTKTERGVRTISMSGELGRVLREAYVAAEQRPGFLFAALTVSG